MSVMVVRILDVQLQNLYGGKNTLIRCYHNRKKFFEMPLSDTPKYLDIFHSVIAYILPTNDQGKNQKFTIIDVGRVENEDRNIEQRDGLNETRDIEHNFQGEIEGFKLGYFFNPNDGNLKAVIWGENQIHIKAFNPDESKETDEDMAGYMRPRNAKILDENDSDFTQSIKKIYDVGATQLIFDEYEDEPEYMVALDKQNNLCLFRGDNWGREFKLVIRHINKDQEDEQNEIKEIFALRLIQTFKIVGLMKVGTSKDYVFQILTFDKSQKDFDESKMLTFNKSYKLLVKEQQEVIKTFQDVICLDDFNNVFYVPAYDKQRGFIRQYQINNDLDKVDDIHINLQIVMNIIANNVDQTKGEKTKGLLIKDFCVADNMLITIHGKVISCYDILDKNKKQTNVILNVENKSFYDFENEPIAIWMNDKICQDTAQRWKIITAFRNGEVQELKYGERKKKNQTELKLVPYLKGENRQFIKLEGKIVKIIRMRNSIHQPVYFVIEKEGRRILASIEFKSQIYREYSIPDTDNDTRYIILDNDLAKQRQEIICIQTKINNIRHSCEQKLIHAVIKIGQFRLKDLNKEVEVINKEDLSEDMVNVKEVDDIFVCGQIIYFVSKKIIDRYNICDNSHQKTTFNEIFQKMIVFDNKFYYWRTVVGGITEERYKSNIYFDHLNDISLIKSQCANKDVQVFGGNCPHLNKLQYDSMSDSLAGFIDFTQIKVFPLLHLSRIKVKMAGKKMNDSHILATKYFSDRKSHILITLDSNNLLKGWNMKYGQFLIERELDQIEEGDFSQYQYHQRIDDNQTLLRSIKPICENYHDAIGQLLPDHDVFWYDSQNDLIKMYKYLVIEIVHEEDKLNTQYSENAKVQKNENDQETINLNQANSIETKPETTINTQVSNKISLNHSKSIEQGTLSTIKEQYRVKIIHKFIGPHYLKTNFGLFAGNNLNQFIFYYKDGEKTKLTYVKVSDKVYKGDEEEFFYLRKQSEQTDQKLLRISIHSPDFKNLIIEKGLRNYSVIDYKNTSQIELPANLSQYTVDTPNFITNDNLSFITEDKIMKSYRWNKDVQNDDNNDNEEFLVTHCNFPGATENIDLATILKVGNHLIGQNCLIYERYVKIKKINKEKNKGKNKGNEKEKSQRKIKELIAPNNFNFFYQEANQESQADSEDFKELKLIQFHYKSKIELCQRSYFGYYFTQKENNDAVMDQLYVVSTFTYYHWRLLILLSNKMINYKKLSRDTLQSLSYVQLQNGSSLLHKLSKNQNKEILEHVYQYIQDPDDEENPFYIPLFKDNKGKTALDITLTTGKTNVEEEGLTKSQSILQNQEIEDEQSGVDSSIISRKTAGLLLKNIGKYPFNLFKLKIKREHIATMIKEDLFEFADFIENCAKTPSFLKALDRANIKIDKTCGSYVFETNDVWVNDQKTLKQKFDKYSKEDKDEKVVTLKILDLVNIHHFIGYSDNQIYQQLSESKNLRIFEKKVIRAMIEQKWELTQKYIILGLLAPYLVFIAIFSIFTMNDFIIKKEDDQFVPQIMILKILILLFVLYFSTIEIIQCWEQGFKNHIKDPWNYLDTVPLIFILFAELINSLIDDSDKLVRGLYSITALAMWLRFLYFFRVFKSTGYYIRMVVEVIKDMGQFFFIFGITVFAFAQANFIVFQNGIKVEQDDNSIIIENGPTFWITLLDTYRNSIGDIQDEYISVSVSNSLAWSLLVVGTLFVVIVLFNLLIAIVGNTFGEVQENKANTMYQELVELIVENQFLITEKKQMTKNQGKYLVMVVPDDEENQNQEEIQHRYKELKGQMKNLNNFFSQSKKESEYNNERNLRTLKKVEDRVSDDNILKLFEKAQKNAFDERILKLFETAQRNVFDEKFKQVFEKINELQEKVLQKISA